MSRDVRAERGRFSNPGSGTCRCEPHWRYFVEKRRGRSRLRCIDCCLLARKTAFQNAKNRSPKTGGGNYQARIDEQGEVSIRGANAPDRAKSFSVRRKPDSTNPGFHSMRVFV